MALHFQYKSNQRTLKSFFDKIDTGILKTSTSAQDEKHKLKFRFETTSPLLLIFTLVTQGEVLFDALYSLSLFSKFHSSQFCLSEFRKKRQAAQNNDDQYWCRVTCKECHSEAIKVLLQDNFAKCQVQIIAFCVHHPFNIS
jgi:hypothetical protein